MDGAKQPTVVVAIDGPAGAGKSTVAKAVAARLDYSYVDTGAMYRALTCKAMRTKTALDDENALVDLARKTSIRLEGNPHSGLKVLLDGEDVSQDIRSAEVTNSTFYIARAPKVRELMVQWQREMGEEQNIVIEGRDIGTVVFPQARFKFYLDADFQERAARRIKELQKNGQAVQNTTLKVELQERDQKDITRPVGPLKKAADAIMIDSTRLSIEEVVEQILLSVTSEQGDG